MPHATIWLVWLGVAGTAFSGYLSGKKFFSQTCAFNETCPYFLGYPACYFGFGLFVALLTIALILWHTNSRSPRLVWMGFATALMGVLFAGYYTLQELPVLFERGLGAYMLVLPTCALGLIFFLIIFGIYARVLRVGLGVSQP